MLAWFLFPLEWRGQETLKSESIIIFVLKKLRYSNINNSKNNIKNNDNDNNSTTTVVALCIITWNATIAQGGMYCDPLNSPRE